MFLRLLIIATALHSFAQATFGQYSQPQEPYQQPTNYQQNNQRNYDYATRRQDHAQPRQNYYRPRHQDRYNNAPPQPRDYGQPQYLRNVDQYAVPPRNYDIGQPQYATGPQNAIPQQGYAIAPQQYATPPPQQYARPPPQQYARPPPQYATPPPPQYARPPPQYATPPPPVYVTPPPTYPTQPPTYATTPPPKCFRNEFGFKCCSRRLHSFMQNLMHHPDNMKKWKNCNTIKQAYDMQRETEREFGSSFESIVAPSDIGNKGRFKGDLMCQTRAPDGKIVLMYATAEQYTTGGTDSRPLTPEEIAAKGWSAKDNEISEISDMDF